VKQSSKLKFHLHQRLIAIFVFSFFTLFNIFQYATPVYAARAESFFQQQLRTEKPIQLPIPNQELVDAASLGDEGVVFKEAQEKGFLVALTKKQRTIVLKRLEGKTYKKIAEELDAFQASVTFSIYASYQKLSNLLDSKMTYEYVFQKAERLGLFGILTEKQIQAVELLLQGKSKAEVARKLKISQDAVGRRLVMAYFKLRPLMEINSKNSDDVIAKTEKGVFKQAKERGLLEVLTEKQKTIVLKRLEGKTHGKIAEELDAFEASVTFSIYASYRRLSNLLDSKMTYEYVFQKAERLGLFGILTEKQMQTAKVMLQGKSRAEVARKLKISQDAVGRRLEMAYFKLRPFIEESEAEDRNPEAEQPVIEVKPKKSIYQIAFEIWGKQIEVIRTFSELWSFMSALEFGKSRVQLPIPVGTGGLLKRDTLEAQSLGKKGKWVSRLNGLLDSLEDGERERFIANLPDDRWKVVVQRTLEGVKQKDISVEVAVNPSTVSSMLAEAVSAIERAKSGNFIQAKSLGEAYEVDGHTYTLLTDEEYAGVKELLGPLPAWQDRKLEIVRDETGKLFVVKNYWGSLGPGLSKSEKNLPDREVLAYLIGQGRVNLVEVRRINSGQYLSALTSNYNLSDLVFQDSRKARSAQLVFQVLIRKTDPHLFNQHEIEGVPVLFDNDLSFRDFGGSIIFRMFAGLFISEFKNTHLLRDLPPEAREYYAQKLEPYLSLEGYDREQIQASIREFQSLDFQALVEEAGVKPYKRKKLVRDLKQAASKLEIDVAEILSELTGSPMPEERAAEYKASDERSKRFFNNPMSRGGFGSSLGRRVSDVEKGGVLKRDTLGAKSLGAMIHTPLPELFDPSDAFRRELLGEKEEDPKVTREAGGYANAGESRILVAKRAAQSAPSDLEAQLRWFRLVKQAGNISTARYVYATRIRPRLNELPEEQVQEVLENLYDYDLETILGKWDYLIRWVPRNLNFNPFAMNDDQLNEPLSIEGVGPSAIELLRIAMGSLNEVDDIESLGFSKLIVPALKELNVNRLEQLSKISIETVLNQRNIGITVVDEINLRLWPRGIRIGQDLGPTLLNSLADLKGAFKLSKRVLARLEKIGITTLEEVAQMTERQIREEIGEDLWMRVAWRVVWFLKLKGLKFREEGTSGVLKRDTLEGQSLGQAGAMKEDLAESVRKLEAIYWDEVKVDVERELAVSQDLIFSKHMIQTGDQSEPAVHMHLRVARIRDGEDMVFFDIGLLLRVRIKDGELVLGEVLAEKTIDSKTKIRGFVSLEDSMGEVSIPVRVIEKIKELARPTLQENIVVIQEAIDKGTVKGSALDYALAKGVSPEVKGMYEILDVEGPKIRSYGYDWKLESALVKDVTDSFDGNSLGTYQMDKVTLARYQKVASYMGKYFMDKGILSRDDADDLREALYLHLVKRLKPSDPYPSQKYLETIAYNFGLTYVKNRIKFRKRFQQMDESIDYSAAAERLNYIQLRADRFSHRLAVLIEQSGWDRKSLAEFLGVVPRTISMWISGNVFPAPYYFPKLAMALDVSVSELISGKFLDEVLSLPTPEMESVESRQIFAAKIMLLRYSAGYSQLELAKQLSSEIGGSISRGTVSKWEREGVVPRASRGFLLELASIFNVSVSELLTGMTRDEILALPAHHLNLKKERRNLALKLKFLRYEQKLSRKSLAREGDISPQIIREIENAKRIASITILVRLADVLSVSLELLQGQDSLVKAKSLGGEIDVSVLDNLEPVNIFMDGREMNAFSLGQKEEIVKLAGMNPKNLQIIVANSLGYEKLSELDLPNIIFTPHSEVEAARSYRRARHNLHISVGIDPSKDFTLIGNNKFRYPNEETGFLAVALLYTQAKNPLAFSLKYGLKRINGFFSSVAQSLLTLVQAHESNLVIAHAA